MTYKKNIFKYFIRNLVNASSSSESSTSPPPPVLNQPKRKRTFKKMEEEFRVNTAAKRIRNESTDGIEPKCESPSEAEHPVEADANNHDLCKSYDETESVEATSFNVSEVSNDGADDRLTICLNCGVHVSGTHANVSYCFSEHMCDSMQKEHQYLNAICLIANAMHANTTHLDHGLKQTTSTPNSTVNQPSPFSPSIASTFSKANQPFNRSNIERALKALLE